MLRFRSAGRWRAAMPQADPSRKRCAIYTRKSSEEGLEQEFNSLQAQSEACEAYIRSQHHEGWALARTRYDDGGFSGGNMERPALQRLLADIQGGRIDIIVVYKVDRLTRSLADFARLVEIFDAQGVSFVSVTQQFNTTSSTAGGIERGGRPFSRGHIYNLLSNPIYIGEIAHKGQLYPGQHPVLIDAETWTAVRDQLVTNATNHRRKADAAEPSLLAGLLTDARGERFTASHAVKKGRRYRYYVSTALITEAGTDQSQGWRLPAQEIEDAVIRVLADALSSPALLIERFGTAIPSDQTRKMLDRAIRLAAVLKRPPAERP